MSSQGFTDTNWGYYFEITSDNTKVDEANDNLMYDLTNDAPAAFWSHVESESGDDVRITNDDGSTAYSFELENFSKSGNTGIIFFDSSILATGSDITWRIYYGNSGASMPASNATLGSENVWNANYKAVYHMDDDPSGASPQLKDSTGNNYDMTSFGSMTSGDLITGKVGKAISFDGSDDAFKVNSTPFTSDMDWTIVAWMNLQGVTNSSAFTSGDKDNGNAVGDALFGPTPSLSDGGDALRGGQAGSFIGTAAGPLSQSTWYFTVCYYDSSSSTYYADVNGGSLTESGGVGNLPTDFDNMAIGARFYNGDNSLYKKMNGYIDEVRVLTTKQSTNWITTEYNNQSSPSTFWTTGSTQENVTVTFTPRITMIM